MQLKAAATAVWFVGSIMYDKDAGHKVFMDDVYESESRFPGGEWSPAGIPWTDVVRSFSLVTSSPQRTCLQLTINQSLALNISVWHNVTDEAMKNVNKCL